MKARLDPAEPLTQAVRETAGALIEAATAGLAEAREAPDSGLHKARKRFKELRSLFRLVSAGDKAFAAREQVRFRDAGRSVAGAREASALVETVDRLRKEFPRRKRRLKALRRALVARRAALGHHQETLAPAIDAAEAACAAGRLALTALSLPDGARDATNILSDGVEHSRKKARKARKHAVRRGQPEDFHALRKAIKAYALQLSMLANALAERKLRKAVTALGETLGELNDLFVLDTAMKGQDSPLSGRKAVRRARSLLRKSAARLSRKSLAEARRVLRKAPKPVESWMEGSAEEPSRAMAA